MSLSRPPRLFSHSPCYYKGPQAPLARPYSQDCKFETHRTNDNVTHDIHHANQRYLQNLSDQSAYTLTIANALWSDITFPLQRNFTDSVKLFYDAKTDVVDFENKP